MLNLPSVFNYKAISKFILFISILLLTFCLFSASVIIYNENLTWSLNISGFENYFIFFNAPIKSFGAFLALLTLYITLERADLNKHNVNLNSYYKHMDEFVKMMKDIQNEISTDSQQPIKLLKSIMKSLNKLDFKKLYRHWYGKDYDTKHKILPENIALVRQYYTAILNCRTYQDLSNARFGDLGNIFRKLGFFPITYKINADDIDHYEYSFVYIIEYILNFSNDTIYNEEGNSLGIDVEKYLHSLDQNKKL